MREVIIAAIALGVGGSIIFTGITFLIDAVMSVVQMGHIQMTIIW